MFWIKRIAPWEISAGPQLRGLLHLAVVLVLLVVFGLLAGCATAAPEGRGDELEVKLPPQVQAACAAEGGCILVTRARLIRMLHEALAAARERL